MLSPSHYLITELYTSLCQNSHPNFLWLSYRFLSNMHLDHCYLVDCSQSSVTGEKKLQPIALQVVLEHQNPNENCDHKKKNWGFPLHAQDNFEKLLMVLNHPSWSIYPLGEQFTTQLSRRPYSMSPVNSVPWWTILGGIKHCPPAQEKKRKDTQNSAFSYSCVFQIFGNCTTCMCKLSYFISHLDPLQSCRNFTPDLL